VPDHCGFFQIVKGDAIGSAALFFELGRPKFVVVLVPVRCRWNWGPPVVVSRRPEGMEAFSFLVVAGVDDANVKDFFEALGNKDVLHRRVHGGKTILVVEATALGVDEFSQRRLRQSVPGTAGIEKDIGLSPLEPTASEKVFGGGIGDLVRQHAPQVLWQNVQIFSALKEEIKVFQVVRPNKSPYRSNLLPLFIDVVICRKRNERKKRQVCMSQRIFRN